MRISDWSSDVCSSDLHAGGLERLLRQRGVVGLARALQAAGGDVGQRDRETFAAVGAEKIGGGGQRFEAAVGMRIEQRAQDLRFPGLLRGGVGGLEQIVARWVRRATG